MHSGGAHMHVKTIAVGQLQTNCYILTDETTKTCAIVDPGDEGSLILDYIEDLGLLLQAIFLTHGHYDHSMAVDDIVRAFDVPVYIHKDDATTETRPDPYRYLADTRTRFYADGDEIPFGNLVVTVLGTPGHSPGSVTLLCDTCLFTGDTLFRDDCGRVDLPGGSLETIKASFRKLASLPGDYEVYPGHGGASTLDRERRFNVYLKNAMSEIS